MNKKALIYSNHFRMIGEMKKTVFKNYRIRQNDCRISGEMKRLFSAGCAQRWHNPVAWVAEVCRALQNALLREGQTGHAHTERAEEEGREEGRRGGQRDRERKEREGAT